MKKSVSLLLVVLILLQFCSVCAVDTVTMYALDGRQLEVNAAETEDYKNVGWFETYEEVTTTLYSTDGRELTVYKAEAEGYKALGWYESYEDVTTTLYALDGKTITVFKAQVEEYKASGWYENYEDVITTLYSMDGRELTVYKAEADAHKALGWYENYEDVVTVMCKKDGKQKKEVYKAEVASYKNNGWVVMQSDAIDPDKPMVAITFDDGPRPESTTRILNTLEFFNAKATFFVVGWRAAKYPSLLKREINIGCQIGNHTYSHPELTKVSMDKIKSEIASTDKAVYSATGKYPAIIRPPYGAYSQTVLSVTDKPLILWSFDTLDWQYRNADYIAKTVLSKVKDGDVILLHDIHDTTAAATEKIVPELLAKGYQLVTVEELAQHKKYKLASHRAYTRFR